MERTEADQEPPVQHLLLFALRRAAARAAQEFQDLLGDDEIRPSAYAVLALLRQRPGIRQSQLSPLLGIRRTNLVPLLATLTGRGLCERRTVQGDRRAAALFLTGPGQSMLARCDAARVAHDRHLDACLGDGGRDRLVALLTLLNEAAPQGMARHAPAPD